ncbi:MAG: arsenite methyltransferase [Candidatus Odinarchaeota archaeon]
MTGETEKKRSNYRGSSSSDDVRRAVREQYAKIATGNSSLENIESTEQKTISEVQNKLVGYSKKELESIPKDANLGLGSGHPIALASVQSGEVVVDLGSGAGVDCFLAAQKVGETGRVIGVDMTPEMIDKARGNAKQDGYKNVEFRLGEIEHLPVADNTADLIISNCVINLAPDKSQVFRDAYRVLKPGGRLMISDIILNHEFPDTVKKALDTAPSCVSRASVKDEYLETIRVAGFEQVEIVNKTTISPRMKPRETGTGKRKRTLITSGHRIEVELTPEEDERMVTAVISAHIRAIKPE